jgi:acid stress-induced BolA-like protein IbaG/YrbA
MQTEQIKVLLEAEFTDSQVDVSVDGSHLNLVVISPAFEGLRAVKKQQLVYAVLADKIADGTLHAVNMKTFTPAEWEQLSNG